MKISQCQTSLSAKDYHTMPMMKVHQLVLFNSNDVRSVHSGHSYKSVAAGTHV